MVPVIQVFLMTHFQLVQDKRRQAQYALLTLVALAVGKLQSKLPIVSVIMFIIFLLHQHVIFVIVVFKHLLKLTLKTYNFYSSSIIYSFINIFY